MHRVLCSDRRLARGIKDQLMWCMTFVTFCQNDFPNIKKSALLPYSVDCVGWIANFIWFFSIWCNFNLVVNLVKVLAMIQTCVQENVLGSGYLGQEEGQLVASCLCPSFNHPCTFYAFDFQVSHTYAFQVFYTFEIRDNDSKINFFNRDWRTRYFYHVISR